MLQVASFSFNDDKGINELLRKHRLAAGASVFVSEGMVIVPYEDGEPKNASQKITDIKEQKNIIFDQLDIITHSQNVLVKLRADAVTRLNEVEADLAEANGLKGKEKFDRVKHCEAMVKEVEQTIREVEAQQRKNNAEIDRMVLNVTLFDEKIKELGG